MKQYNSNVEFVTKINKNIDKINNNTYLYILPTNNALCIQYCALTVGITVLQ